MNKQRGACGKNNKTATSTGNDQVDGDRCYYIHYNS